ncbi:hypothetical protein AVEN_50157-1 [Araneus ventricosus]|uniref:Uncharacterized protein n=1 Tax=Araneus ventricosus TaxID=182803 RepID=A0A4Y2U5X5_ARAVE|nr:hypothetical protein AVEN_50157-1 [Araneus ventricosus]
MLVRFTELEMSIRTTIALLDKDVDVLLPEEWLLAQKIKLVLQPMKELTDFISGEKYPSASSVIIVIQGIQEDLKELKTKKENHAVFGLMESLESELMMRVGSLEESSIFTNSTFLDPRYKNIFFSKEETADLTKKKLRIYWKKKLLWKLGPKLRIPPARGPKQRSAAQAPAPVFHQFCGEDLTEFRNRIRLSEHLDPERFPK